MRLEAASNLVRFYKTVGRSIIKIIIQWDPIIKNFKQEWDILVNRNGEVVTDLPKISNVIPIIKWTRYFADFLYRAVGERKS